MNSQKKYEQDYLIEIEALRHELDRERALADKYARQINEEYAPQLAAMTAERDELTIRLNGDAPAGWVEGYKLERANESKREAMQQLAAMMQERDALLSSTDGSLVVRQMKAIAASQAYSQQLREALEFLVNRCNEQGFYSPVRQPIITQALALPSDDTALKQYGAKLLRDAAEQYGTEYQQVAVIDILRRAGELEAKP
jgi:hypothetical protein